ncbi:K04069 pyruvate formate lyase activating enzyme (plasmid) [Sinorhizobium fredii HH103]|uniref:K04069 pyruvate formate lyase activating enzyme n=1 Tax=Sinorhizobium fredii (strain HH103) TaxID=1117943 RepID=G9ABY8_SINF1|nr:AmmeMemoRadiSam system radical SAM enzyme [Sinorhizobium fredii]CCE98567.1 K04069 pyruvate formate lyase activating enzyme [Sinorhizobium fredii HH103]
MQKWRDLSHPARLASSLPDGRVQCSLSPRRCKLKEGQHGYCGVRANKNGRLVTLNYGKSVAATVETVETEAINHFWPGAPILSLGNIGCMMNCVYCHNWKTSQAKHVSDTDVFDYTPEAVVELALERGIRIISWTYNDPVVWHEFVLDTSEMARKNGIKTLYKSAFYISQEAVSELLDVIDIFSISLKSVREEYYRKLTGGHVQPVLDGIKTVFKSGRHLELSNLMVTGISDDEASALEIAHWVLRETSPWVPLHYVRFHPDYKMTNSSRTPIPNLVQARANALAAGLNFVYVGNVFDESLSSTFCHACGEILVHRYGLSSKVINIEAGRCRNCGTPTTVVAMPKELAENPSSAAGPCALEVTRQLEWNENVSSVHVSAASSTDQGAIMVRHILRGGEVRDETHLLSTGHSFRFLVSKSDPSETGVQILMPRHVVCQVLEVFDRAHFPTLAVEQVGSMRESSSPLPRYPRS